MANLKLSAFADEYSPSFDKQLEYLKENNIEYIELRFLDGKNIADLTEDEVMSVKKKLDNANIKVSSLGSPLGKINLEDDFSEHLVKCEKVFKTANILGVKNIRVFSFYLPDGKTREECRGDVLSRLEEMVTLAEKYGVTLCHENEAKIYGESPEYCLDILSHFGGRLKCVFDMGNFVLDGYKPFPCGYEMLKDYIEYFHIKDSLYAGAIVPPGCGEASIPEIFAQVKKDFPRDVLVTLEPHLETFSGLNQLVGKSFENPYKFESPEAAFDEAVCRIKEILK
ncbi:MAG: sugar phosphate isomerase/epimerase [Clostridia bacterium]|nr:sugar phosphate isomerase/epimerase [Clostridia bacterium]